MLDYIDAAALKRMFIAGAANLDANKEYINELNVFPVPDGDTGTNMTLTVMSAVKELNTLGTDPEMDEVSSLIASGTLRGARGNSGVIMSQLCRGFTKDIKGKDRLYQTDLAAACERAVATAYKAVMKPKEGTILTVARAISDKAAELSESDILLEEKICEVIKAAEDMLEKTPDLLPVLKEAGVVDSGGQGLIEFLKGALEGYRGKEAVVDPSAQAAHAAPVSAGIDSSNISTADIKFGYCTEFIVMTENEFTEKDETEFKSYLSSLGDSLVLVAMDNIVKVHVHTNHPGLAFEKGLTYGSLTSMKVDNMREEHREKVISEADRQLAKEKEEKQLAARSLPHKEYGFIAVCCGKGMEELYKGMSVDVVIEGGQTMNPSTKDFINAIEQINSEKIFIFPNNSNVILAAQQACEMYQSEEKQVKVIPSKTVTQGITSLFNFVPAKSFEENERNMTAALGDVKTVEVTYAVRDTSIEGTEVKKGDYMGIGDGRILSDGSDLTLAAVQAVQALYEEDSELITVYYGEDISEEDAGAMAEKLGEALDNDDLDIEVIYGGQPVYYYIISVE